MTTKNYKSDFDAILHLVSCVGDTKKEIGWPDYDWVARFYTTSHDNVYIASNIGGVLTTCFNDNGNIHVVFNNHGLGSGTLRVEFSAEIPNDIYPDGSQLEVSPQPLDIELVRGRGDCGTTAEIEAMLPYIKGPKGDKGDKMTFEDLTEQDKAELIAPIREDIDKALANKSLFCDLWDAACGALGQYNSQTGYFELNGLTDITYEEAVRIFVKSLLQSNANVTNWSLMYWDKTRTNIPLVGRIIDGTLGFYMCNIERLVLHRASDPASCKASNFNIVSVKEVETPIYITSGYPVGPHPFGSGLIKLLLHRVSGSVNLSNCPLLTLESFSYLVANASNTSAITITVHPDVYAKLTDETNTEWHQVLLDAAEKNINFATT